MLIGPERYLPVFRTHDLSDGTSATTQGVIVIHGTGRTHDWNFETMVLAATAAGILDQTVIVSPKFQTAEDGPRGDEPFWTNSAWKRGHLSSTDGPDPRISSYAALDRIVVLLSDPRSFPNLERIVVVGHSAGGQVTHRYAAGGNDVASGLDILYVVANPSTYLFLREERPDGDGYSLPDRDLCPDYNEWHYGLEDQNSYMSRLTDSEIIDNLVNRNVAIMVGTEDTGSAQLDVSCGANLQGPHRYSRGMNLMRYMSEFFPTHHHTEVIVEGVAHSTRGMFTSAAGLEVLFTP